MKNIQILVLLLAAWGMLGLGCDDTPSFEQQQEIDRALIEEYIAVNNLDGYFLDNGVYVDLEKPGVGTENPNIASLLQIELNGKFLDGEVFWTTGGQPQAWPVSRFIRGLQDGIQEFKAESEGLVIIPSRLAYGVNGQGEIPPNAVIMFEVILFEFD
jgi:FKBP-type peptidyl-prolyl cis-trans isomerase FkpA